MGRKKKLVNNTTIPQYAIERFARCVFDDIRADFANPEIQADFAIWQAEQAAKKVREEKQAKSVKVIIMNPQNGEIYAMVNEPEFAGHDPAQDHQIANIIELGILHNSITQIDADIPEDLLRPPIITLHELLDQSQLLGRGQFFTKFDTGTGS